MIQTNKAGLITSGQDLIRALCWDTDTTGLSVKGQLKLKLEETRSSDRKNTGRQR